MTGPKTPPDVESIWRYVLTEEHRSKFAFLPSSPRCIGCQEPFRGIGGVLMAMIGHRPSRKNPNFCNYCDDILPVGGAEVDVGVLFADVRSSTALAEKLGPKAFADTLNRFYDVANETLIKYHAMIDKMVGDEVMALFIPSVCKAEHRRRLVESAAALAGAVKSLRVQDEPLPVGIGIHCGSAFVGKIGSSSVRDFTALGDTINTAARLQAEAASGQLVLSEEAYQESPELFPGAEQRSVTLRGRAESLAIRVYRAPE
jgi:adenylate cyclase